MTIDLAGGVAAALTAAGRAFGLTPAAAPAPRWGALYARLDADPSAGFVAAIELIYEGYLLHYRESRVAASAASDLETKLLAGDFFYARGLRSIAARGDAAAVGLLARLMATCSYLRSIAAPFSDDDALWAYAMGGLAAQHAGLAPRQAAGLFDEIDAMLSLAAAPDVRAAAARAARLLALRAPEPLLLELEGDITPAAGPTDGGSSSAAAGFGGASSPADEAVGADAGR